MTGPNLGPVAGGGKSQAIIARCRVCHATYDVDFEPPLFCHDDGQWELRVEPREPR